MSYEEEDTYEGSHSGFVRRSTCRGGDNRRREEGRCGDTHQKVAVGQTLVQGQELGARY